MRENKQAGLIKLLLIIIAAVLLLSYFHIDLRGTLNQYSWWHWLTEHISQWVKFDR